MLVTIEQQIPRITQNSSKAQGNDEQSFDNSQIVPQPKGSGNIPQPIPYGEGPRQAQNGVRRDRASRSPVKDRNNVNERDRP